MSDTKEVAKNVVYDYQSVLKISLLSSRRFLPHSLSFSQMVGDLNDSRDIKTLTFSLLFCRQASQQQLRVKYIEGEYKSDEKMYSRALA